MVLPDLRPEKVEINERHSSREEFLQRFSGFVMTLSDVEKGFPATSSEKLGQITEVLNKHLTSQIRDLPPNEEQLLRIVYGLWSLKNDIPTFSDIPEFREFIRGRGVQEISVEMGGPVGVGKSTIAKFLASEIGAKVESERFTESENPFLTRAYKDPGFMLRTQVKFLLDNILVGLRGKFDKGRWVRDTSVLSDIYVFMEWRRRAGIVTEDEHKTYMDLVMLLKPLIPRPDLLVLLVPNSGERLMEGLWERIRDNPEERKMEEGISPEDLDICIQATKDAAIVIREEFGIQVHVLEIDPVEVYREPSLRYEAVYKIRERLGLLKELLLKDPNKVAADIVRIFASSLDPQVVVVHSPSMFTGKTSTLNFVAETVGRENVVSFQPAAALRYGQEHLNHMIDRDGRKIPAFTTQSSRLTDVLAGIVQRGITPRNYPFVFIDEVMLYINSSPKEAVGVIEELRSRGFKVICDGIDYTFQEEPFTFSHELVARSLHDSNWHEVELATRCKYCERPARGTRRLTPDGSIANYTDTAYQAGDNYEPVCCDLDKSCEGQPPGFKRKTVPNSDDISDALKENAILFEGKKSAESEELNRQTVEIRGKVLAWARRAVKRLRQTGDYRKFFSSAKKHYTWLRKAYGYDDIVVNPFVVAVIVTDMLAERWELHGNKRIIKEAQKLGINPHPNVYGERLAALDCLAEILANSKL